jgi:hypothetical protein
MNPTAQLTWINRLTLNSRDYTSESFAETLGENKTTENQSHNLNRNDDQQFGWFTDLTLRKKMQKDGRVVSGRFDMSLGDMTTSGFVDNETSIFRDGMPDYSERILQDQESDEEQLNYGFRLSYTEPLNPKLFLGFNASRRNYKNDNQNQFFELDPNNPSARIRNVQLSNHYRKDYTFNRAGSNLRYVGKSLNVSGGMDFQQSDLNGDLVSENGHLNKNLSYFLPAFNIDYELASSKSIQFSYRTSVREPSIEQLQPNLNNTDPLNVYQGNPDLKPEYIHDGNVHLMLFDQFSFTNLFANLNLRYTTNKISNKSVVDEKFRQVLSPVNTDHDFNTNLYSSFSTPLKFIKSKISFDVSANYNRGILYVNDQLNKTDRWANNYTLTLENRKKETIDLALGMSLGTSDVKYSENEESNQRYFDQTWFTDLSWYLPKNWTFETSFDYTSYSDELFGSKDKLFIWQAKIAKAFLKNERGTIELRVFDILNQNQGINRSNSLNYVQESRTNVLGRYIVFSMKYKLSGFGQGSGMNIEVKDR